MYNVLYFETRSLAMGWVVDVINLVQNTKLSEEDKTDILLDIVELINESQPV